MYNQNLKKKCQAKYFIHNKMHFSCNISMVNFNKKHNNKTQLRFSYIIIIIG